MPKVQKVSSSKQIMLPGSSIKNKHYKCCNIYNYIRFLRVTHQIVDYHFQFDIVL